MRNVYMVLSPRALSYATDALITLFHNSLEPLHLHLITDSPEDKQRLSEAVAKIDAAAKIDAGGRIETIGKTETAGNSEALGKSGTGGKSETGAGIEMGQHRWSVFSEDDLADREAQVFGAHANLRRFRHGHPCWRKITDPLLLSEPGEELVLLDPDLYFPNRFTFEPTPASGVLLMWQRPNCLFPPEVVNTAIASGIRLAHHVDIGVGHWRANADLDWMDWLIGQLGGKSLPRIMHVEAIVWAALAMRIGGGHLDPVYWKCWRRSPAKRVMTKMGVSGVSILRSEPWSRVKCFHAGGEAKSWLHAAQEQGVLQGGAEHTQPGRVIPYVELTPAHYARERAFKRMLQAVGYYQIFRPA